MSFTSFVFRHIGSAEIALLKEIIKNKTFNKIPNYYSVVKLRKYNNIIRKFKNKENEKSNMEIK